MHIVTWNLSEFIFSVAILCRFCNVDSFCITLTYFYVTKVSIFKYSLGLKTDKSEQTDIELLMTVTCYINIFIFKYLRINGSHCSL